MQKETKDKKSTAKKPGIKINIKKRLSERQIKKKSKPVEDKNIKKRVSVKNSKQDNQFKIGAFVVLILAIIVVYIALGIEFAAIATVGSGLIIGLGLLLRKFKSTAKRRKIVNILIIIFLTLGILAIIAVGAFILYVKSIADPVFAEKEKGLQTSETTLLYNIHGEVFKKLGTEQRTKVKYEDLPEVLVDAIIATEDSRFFQHNGFDAPRFMKAGIQQVMGVDGAGGASTLTMQVAKNTFSRDEEGEIASGMNLEGIARKFQDIYLSIFKLEKKYTKQEIIEFYVNNHFLGGSIYGVAEASTVYFGKDVSELNLSEAAIIAGMFKSPNYYRPTVNPKNAADRRDTVLYLMERHGYITAEERKIAASIPVESLTSTAGQETDVYQGYIDTIVEELNNKYNLNPYKTSLKVYTNLDPSKQDAVNRVMNGEAYTWVNDVVQAGVAVVDSETGKILAIGNGRAIGDRSHGDKSILNYATQIKRQPGSTAKPLFDYAPGIEYNNWSTYELFDDSPYTYSTGQSIKNWDGGYFGTITLRRALATSRNIPALKAFQAVDNKKIVEFVTNLGLKPEISNGRIHEAHCIGSFTGTNPLEMAAAYAAFSNGGFYNEPYSVNKVVNRSTGETFERTKDNYVIKRRVMSEATAFMIADVLQDVALNGGTPKNMAVKTGTTNFDYKYMAAKGLPDDAIMDSWVVGFTTKTTMALWYGYNNADKVYCLRNLPDSRRKDQIYNALVRQGAVESNRSAFKQPSSVTQVGIAAGSNPAKLATSTTQNVVYEYFKNKYVPTEYDEAPLAKPQNLIAKYSLLTKKVTLKWDAVKPSSQEQDSYGSLGYNIYKDGVLLDWTSKTSYSFETTTPYSTYKVVATYKSYSGIQSDPATFTLKEDTEEEEKPNPSPTATPSPKPTVAPTAVPTTPPVAPTPTPEAQ